MIDIQNKKHCNKNLLKFNIELCNCIIIPCLKIDLYERYYINLFKKLKLANIIIPSYNEELNYIDLDKFIIRKKLKTIDKKYKNIINNVIFLYYINKNKKINIYRIKNILLRYFLIIKTIGDIESLEWSKISKIYYFNFKNKPYTLAVHQNIKKIENLKNINIDYVYNNKILQKELEIIVFKK